MSGPGFRLRYMHRSKVRYLRKTDLKREDWGCAYDLVVRPNKF